ncbi:MAG: hypothetical protein IPG80_16995 [Anaerolineales bacterium]|jgi:hypothetical protein|uniref:hypothetical protein n=1 Tax=Candidatus Villigracilis vicinus TaxID=3140679 RepID=UPI003136C123|nr:hypothetical protein [Anaerolineales bacterium]MBK7451631.1 hypothetical protein [Anaerolineales bacterium]MBK9782437.1 hypothetical protein [Anaerolineales bacterium]
MSDIKHEIAALVSKKVKITDAQALQAVEVVLDFVEKKLPPNIGNKLDAILSGNVDLSDGIGLDDAAGLLGGLLGDKK